MASANTTLTLCENTQSTVPGKWNYSCVNCDNYPSAHGTHNMAVGQRLKTYEFIYNNRNYNTDPSSCRMVVSSGGDLLLYQGAGPSKNLRLFWKSNTGLKTKGGKTDVALYLLDRPGDPGVLQLISEATPAQVALGAPTPGTVVWDGHNNPGLVTSDNGSTWAAGKASSVKPNKHPECTRVLDSSLPATGGTNFMITNSCGLVLYNHDIKYPSKDCPRWVSNTSDD
jgi:hypothetical protein